MATLTRGHSFASNQVVTPQNLNDLVDLASISGIVNSEIASNAAIAHTKLANISASQVLMGNASNVPTATALSGDVTISSLGVTTISNGAVTADKLAAGAAVPPGAVMPFAMNAAPSGWLVANGAAVSRTTYAALFAAIGTIYGTGDGSTTFALPDLRGYFVRGWGVSGQIGPNSDGTVSGAFGAKQADELKGHRHFTVSDAASAASTTLTASNYLADEGAGVLGSSYNYELAGSATDATLGPTSSTDGTETRPKNIAMLYCIKF